MLLDVGIFMSVFLVVIAKKGTRYAFERKTLSYVSTTDCGLCSFLVERPTQRSRSIQRGRCSHVQHCRKLFATSAKVVAIRLHSVSRRSLPHCGNHDAVGSLRWNNSPATLIKMDAEIIQSPRFGTSKHL